MAKLMAPNIRIDWYPEGHFKDPSNPLPDELNSGYNLYPAIVTGFTLDFTDSNTANVTSIFDNYNSELFTHSSHEGDIQFFLAPRGSNAANERAYRTAESLFYLGLPKSGYLVKRFGYKWDTPYEINHKVVIFKVHSTTPKVISEEDGPILLEVTFLPDGEAYSSVDGLLSVPTDNLIRNGDIQWNI